MIGQRAGRKVVELVRRAAKGSTEEFRTFTTAQFLHTAGDGAVALAMANTLFFAVPLGEARGKVALYLLLTMVPYALVAPFLGRLVDRSRLGGRRILVAGFALRCVMGWALTTRMDSLLVFPLTLLILVASRAHGITRTSMVPELRPPAHSLMWSNTWMSVISSAGGALGGIAAVAVVQVSGSGGAMALATILYAAGVLLAFALPKRRVRHAAVPDAAPAERAEETVDVVEEKPRRRVSRGELRLDRRRREAAEMSLPAKVRAAGVAMIVIRVAVGYLTFFLAFVLKDDGTVALPAVVGAAALGGAAGAAVAPALKRWVPQWVLPSVMLVMVAVAAIWASTDFGVPTAMLIAAVVGLASAGGRLAFDSEVQHAASPGARGTILTRYEVIFQVGWIIGAALSLPPWSPGYGLMVLALIALLGLVSAWRVYYLHRSPRWRSPMPPVGDQPDRRGRGAGGSGSVNAPRS